MYRIFEGTNEINRLIIPATLLERLGRGALTYTEFLSAMDSVVNRTRLLLGHGSADDDALRVAMTNAFVASANERVVGGARRLLANEFEGDELATHLRLERIIPHMPIRTIAVKTRIAEALLARGLGPVFLR